MKQSELKLILALETESIRALAHLETSLEKIAEKHLKRLNKPLRKLDDLIDSMKNKKIEYFDDAEVDAIMLDILDEYAPAFKALAKND